MYSSEKTIRVVHSPQAYRSAETTSYLRTQWLPSQPTVQREIREAFKAGLYDEDRERLKSDLEKDPATLFQCLKALPGFIPQSERALDPLKSLDEMPKGVLRTFLDSTLVNRSVHLLGKGSEVQRHEIARSLLTSTAAVVLSRAEVAPSRVNIGVVAHLRNLGRLLIAWNYPQIFRRAKKIAKQEGVDTDTAVEQVLGIAPQSVGYSIAREWGLHPEVLQTLAREDNRQSTPSSHSITTLCNLAEEYVDDVLLVTADGHHADGIKRIEAALAEKYDSKMLDHLKSVMSTELVIVRDRLAPKLAKDRKTVAPTATPSIKIPRSAEVSDYAREIFEDFIRRHAEHRSVRTGLEQMVQEIIPALGFVAGCLYVLNSSQTLLVPTVQIGERRERGYPTVDLRMKGLVAESLFSPHPLVQDASLFEDEVVSQVTGAATLLGQEIVLALQWKTREALKGHPGALFKGIASCLRALGDAAVLERIN